MSTNFIPGKDALFQTFANNLASKLPAVATSLSIPAATVTALTNAASNYTSAMAFAEEMKTGYRGAVGDKDTKRTVAEQVIRQVNNLAQLSPNATPSVLGDLGLPVRATSGSPLDAFTPTNLVAKANGVNGNTLKWNRNGNGTGIIFFLEFKLAGETTWTPLDVTTKASHKHSTAVPGQEITYRVYARSATKTSGFSNYASVYDDDGSNAVFIGKAA